MTQRRRLETSDIIIALALLAFGFGFALAIFALMGFLTQLVLGH